MNKQSNSKTKVLTILGMHRSGTSLTTQWLHKMGLHVGDQLLGAAASNKYGHYEDLDFFNFHKSVLDKNDVLYYASRNDLFSVTQEDEAKAKAIVSEKLQKDQWGWKDPRTCLFVNFWNKLLAEKGIQPKFLIVYRPVEQVVDSLVRRDVAQLKLNPNMLKRWYHLRKYQKGLKSLQLAYKESWVHHLTELKILHLQQEENCLLIKADDLLETQNTVYDTLTKSWGFDLEFVDFSTCYEKKLMANLPMISKYGDDDIAQLHSYFTKAMTR